MQHGKDRCLVRSRRAASLLISYHQRVWSNSRLLVACISGCMAASHSAAISARGRSVIYHAIFICDFDGAFPCRPDCSSCGQIAFTVRRGMEAKRRLAYIAVSKLTQSSILQHVARDFLPISLQKCLLGSRETNWKPVLHAYRISDDGVRDNACRYFGHALSSVSLLADRTPRSPLVPVTTFLFL